MLSGISIKGPSPDQRVPQNERIPKCQMKGHSMRILKHGLRTPNEGINQRKLKFWADVADNICFGRT